jgi:predicted nucleotidyltransferase
MKYEKAEILNYLRSNKEFYRVNFNIVKIGIFGSYSRDTQTGSSDIDIIFEFGEKTTNIFDKKYELRKQLSEHFKTNIDICRERAIKSIFKESILGEAIFV